MKWKWFEIREMFDINIKVHKNQNKSIRSVEHFDCVNCNFDW